MEELVNGLETLNLGKKINKKEINTRNNSNTKMQLCFRTL